MDRNQLDTLEQKATDAAIRWAQSGFGYFTMERSVNGYIEALGANRAIGDDTEAIRLGREAAALHINICVIHALNKSEELQLHEALIKIANDLPCQSRGMRR